MNLGLVGADTISPFKNIEKSCAEISLIGKLLKVGNSIHVYFKGQTLLGVLEWSIISKVLPNAKGKVAS